MKYKVGDKVRITTDKSKSNYWNDEGMMDRWMGKTMTINSVGSDYYKMKEDDRWYWFEEMIDGLAEVKDSKPKIKDSKYSICINSDGKTTIATMTVNGKEIKSGTAKCSPKDRFNFKAGAGLALERMWASGEKEKKPKIRANQDKRITKKGEHFWRATYDIFPHQELVDGDLYTTFVNLNPTFKTQEECRDYIFIHRDFEKRSFNPDWKDENQAKYQFYFDYRTRKVNCLCLKTFACSKYSFESIEVCNELIEKWGSDRIAKYILGIDL